MSVIEELKKLVELREKGLLEENEFQQLKINLIEKVTISEIGTSNIEKNDLKNTINRSTLILRYEGVGGLIDSTIKFFVDGNLHSKNSVIHGFSHKIELIRRDVDLKFVVLFKSTNIKLTNLDLSKNYEITLGYDMMWGKISKKYHIKEV